MLTYGLNQDQTLTTSTNVPAGQVRASFNTKWPGGDIVMTLVSPSGRVFDRSTDAPDAFHQAGPTFETYAMVNPEPGKWTVKLYGARVWAAEGDAEPVTLDIYTEPRPNQLPIAKITKSGTGRTVTVTASGSTDPDGVITKYEWEFGDGAMATGPTATHTYAPGVIAAVRLIVTDNSGGLGFASTDDFTVPR